ncbi:MAG TPA: carbonic anhydrase [bacterium]|nr:carbonic anhydrase [bacterium]
MRTQNLKWMLAALILVTGYLYARDRSGILLTSPEQEGTKQEKKDRLAIKKEQDAAMKMLMDGNKYHVGHRKWTHRPTQIMIVSCADSHVPPEQVFHMNPGELYTNRAWGNIVDKALLGSLEYGAEQLGCHVLVVMGHTDCTALRDAIAEYWHPRVSWKSLNEKALYEELKPGVAEMIQAQVVTKAQTGSALEGQDLIDAVVRNNVLNTMRTIRQKSPLLWNLESTDKLKIVGCIYNRDTGVVKWLK